MNEKYFLDIPLTETMEEFDTLPEAMSEFYKTNVECELTDQDGEIVAEKYHIEGDEITMEEIVYGEYEYVEL